MERLKRIVIDALDRLGEDILEGRITLLQNPLRPHAPRTLRPFIKKEEKKEGEGVITKETTDERG